MDSTSRLWLLSLCFIVCFLFASSAAAQSLPDSTVVQLLPDSAAVSAASGVSVPVPDTHRIQYLRGKKMARKETKSFGSFFTGFMAGTASPFILFLPGSALCEKQKGPVFWGLNTSGAALWLWGGHRLATRSTITVPGRHHAGLTEGEQAHFNNGYIDTARGKRSSAYTWGVVSGVFIGVPLIIITDILINGLDIEIGGV